MGVGAFLTTLTLFDGLVTLFGVGDFLSLVSGPGLEVKSLGVLAFFKFFT